MSSFLPIPEYQQQEVQAIQQQLCHQLTHMPWPTVDNEPLNEYLTPFLELQHSFSLFPLLTCIGLTYMHYLAAH